MNTLGYIIFLFGCISFLSCTKESESPTEIFSEYKIKRKLFFEGLNDSIAKKILYFQYNYDNLLEKIYHFSGDNPSEYYKYESFEYEADKPSVRYTYNYDSEFLVWRIIDSSKYSY
jgi:hypothetical protein